MKQNNTIKQFIKITISLLSLAIFGAGIFYLLPLIQHWNKPLAPGLGLPTIVVTNLPTQGIQPSASSALPASVATNDNNEIHQGNTTATDASPIKATVTAAKPNSTQTPAPQPYCGGPQTMTVLALGIDTRADNYLYGLADVIKIVRVDFVTPKITSLSMPRDLWVQIPEIAENYGITEGKLNQAYFYGTEGMGYYHGPGGAPGLLARTLALNFGVHVDHYGTVNMRTFEKMIDAVGGIDLYLPYSVDGRPKDDKTDDLGFFPAGHHHFNGDQALRFSRIRKIDTIFARMDRQTMVLCALREKLLTPNVLTSIPQLITSFQNSMITDLSPAQISQLACLLPNIKKENIIFTSLPKDILTPSRIYDPHRDSRTSIWKADNDVIRDYVARFQSGTWPDKPDKPSCP